MWTSACSDSVDDLFPSFSLSLSQFFCFFLCLFLFSPSLSISRSFSLHLSFPPFSQDLSDVLAVRAYILLCSLNSHVLDLWVSLTLRFNCELHKHTHTHTHTHVSLCVSIWPPDSINKDCRKLTMKTIEYFTVMWWFFENIVCWKKWVWPLVMKIQAIHLVHVNVMLQDHLRCNVTWALIINLCNIRGWINRH